MPFSERYLNKIALRPVTKDGKRFSQFSLFISVYFMSILLFRLLEVAEYFDLWGKKRSPKIIMEGQTKRIKSKYRRVS